MSETPENLNDSDAALERKMDGLLQNFFRMEMPYELHQPFDRARAIGAQSRPTQVTLSTAVDSERSRRIPLAVVPALAALAMSLVFIFTSSISTPESGNQATGRGPKVDPAEKLMNVSPGSDSSKGVVGDDGVTLEETDGVELRPRP